MRLRASHDNGGGQEVGVLRVSAWNLSEIAPPTFSNGVHATRATCRDARQNGDSRNLRNRSPISVVRFCSGPSVDIIVCSEPDRCIPAAAKSVQTWS